MAVVLRVFRHALGMVAAARQSLLCYAVVEWKGEAAARRLLMRAARHTGRIDDDVP